MLIKMLKDSRGGHDVPIPARRVSAAVSSGVAATICDKAGIGSRIAAVVGSARMRPRRCTKRMQETPIRSPSTDCLLADRSGPDPRRATQGREGGVLHGRDAQPDRSIAAIHFRSRSAWRTAARLGPDPAAVEQESAATEAVVRRGKRRDRRTRATSQAKLYGFANRACRCSINFRPAASLRRCCDIDWRRYGLSQPSGQLLPQGRWRSSSTWPASGCRSPARARRRSPITTRFARRSSSPVQDCGCKLQALPQSPQETALRDRPAEHLHALTSVNWCQFVQRDLARQ